MCFCINSEINKDLHRISGVTVFPVEIEQMTYFRVQQLLLQRSAEICFMKKLFKRIAENPPRCWVGGHFISYQTQ